MTKSLQVAVLSLCALAVSLASCAAQESTLSPTVAAPAPSPASASLDAGELARWMAFRKTFGLPSDLAWVTKVARDPTATIDFGVPLLPQEVDIVSRRNRTVQELMPAVIAYGQRFPDYGGARIDGPRAVIEFSTDVKMHQQELDKLFGPDRIQVLMVPYSTADLAAKSASVMAERDWLASIGVDLIDADPDELSNTVELRYVAPDRSAEPAMLAHFGSPSWLSLRWLGPPPWTGPWGDLLVRVVDPAGRALPATAAVSCIVTPVESSVRYTALPTGADGSDSCRFRHVPAVAFNVEVSYQAADGETMKLSRLANVPAGGTGSVLFVAPG